VNVTYGILRRRGEFLAYHDERCNLTFSGDKGEIDLLESKIGRLITVTLEAIPDSHELTLALLLPRSTWRARDLFRDVGHTDETP
jgi:hypothetical protein